MIICYNNIHRLFFGDKDPLIIISIIIIQSRSNLKGHIGAITSLDAIISDQLRRKYVISKRSGYDKIFAHLFDYCLGQEMEMKFNEYLYRTFKCFVNHKDKIDIDMHCIDEYIEDKKVQNLLFYDIISFGMRYDNKDISKWMDANNNTQNLLKPIFFDVFKNVKEVKIKVDYLGTGSVYPFSLLSLLSIIQNTEVNKVLIYTEPRPDLTIWESLFSISSFDSIVNNFKENQYGIKIDQTDIYVQKLMIYKL